MGITGSSYTQEHPLLQRGGEAAPAAQEPRPGMRKFRLTFVFAATAIMVISVAILVVNQVIGDLAESKLVRMAEENTARDAAHIESMVRGDSMGSMAPTEAMTGGRAGPGMQHPVEQDMESAGAMTDGKVMQGMQHSKPLSLEFLASPAGLPATFPMLVEGFNIVKLSLSDLNGNVVWSTDTASIGLSRHESPLFQKAAAGEISSKLTTDKQLIDLGGLSRRLDVVQTNIPLRDTPSGSTVAVMELYRNVANDVALQVEDTRSEVLWTTVATMGGLFLVLLGFIVVADRSIYRTNRRAMSVIEEANESLETRVQQRTRELEDANVRLVDAQERVVRTEKLAAIGQLAGGVAHDLRNPLGAINNAVYYLKRKLGGTELASSNPRIEQFLEIVEGEVQHSNEIITDLLTFARDLPPIVVPQVMRHW